ncbi:hypothetical protein [Ekhidna sp.]
MITFGVDDMGRFLTEKAKLDDTEFLSIRHFIAYRNGAMLATLS